MLSGVVAQNTSSSGMLSQSVPSSLISLAVCETSETVERGWQRADELEQHHASAASTSINTLFPHILLIFLSRRHSVDVVLECCTREGSQWTKRGLDNANIVGGHLVHTTLCSKCLERSLDEMMNPVGFRDVVCLYDSHPHGSLASNLEGS